MNAMPNNCIALEFCCYNLRVGIEVSDGLIDQVVYRLYGLTEEDVGGTRGV
jgi:hypothetical protein